MIGRLRRLAGRLDARHGRTAVYLVVATAGSVGLIRTQQAIDEVHALVAAEEAEERVEEAQACINSWERVPQLRSAIEVSVREGSTAGAGAVLDVATQVADEPLPPDVDQLLEAAVDERVRRVVAEVVAQYPDPDCDLAHARRVTDNQEQPS